MESEHFKDAELACHHCGVNLCQQELLDALEALRVAIGKPILVDDAYRCAVHNAEVGGAPHSEHLQGIAADIRVEGMTAAELEAVARQIPAFRGIGRSDQPPYLHVDTRAIAAEWCYTSTGTVIAYYAPGDQSAGVVA
jgi:uncharacterized protein YcbK (DUF882 family)